ncbi:hypothetical protein L1987_13593 [Smallanthus sonchifolius]|uniref:Uncharacterized protein n=1 Tax=Smallanthus sonchifolius TaxID=185202 RepID=A0ACB9JJ10_9ASTR|nr:hypothetical protein L1987_13593 [Smallanthus sonchifolius]
MVCPNNSGRCREKCDFAVLACCSCRDLLGEKLCHDLGSRHRWTIGFSTFLLEVFYFKLTLRKEYSCVGLAIAYNPSPVVIPQQHGRSFEVRSQAIQNFPKYHGLGTEEPYLHLSAYDARCNTIGGQRFTPDDVNLFLDEFYTNQRTSDARKNIRNFQQQSGQLFHEAFLWFKMLIKNCPHHGLQMWELLNAFHEGLTDDDAHDLNSNSNGGTFEDVSYIQGVVGTMILTPTPITRAIETIPISTMGMHPIKLIRIFKEVVKDVNNHSHPGTKTITKATTKKGIKEGMSKEGHMDPLISLKNQSDEVHDKSIQVFTTQMEQIATEVADLRNNSGKLPSDTQTNPSHQASRSKNTKSSHLGKVSTLRSGKVYDNKVAPPPTFVDGVVEDIDEHENSDDELKPIPVTRVAFKNQNEKSFSKTSSTVNEGEVVAISLSFSECSKAQLDLGASVSILPSSLYDQYDFGPLRRANTTVMLADLTPKLPRGIVSDVIVKFDQFYHPVDFLVLDYVQSEKVTQPIVILGRSLLATSHSLIDRRLGIVDMTFGNRKVRLNIFSNKSDPLPSDECFMADIIEGCHPHSEDESIEVCFVCDRPPWTHHVESLPTGINSGLKPSLVSPPKVELKDLPKNLKYSFLGDDETLPVIIASNLDGEQEEALLKIITDADARPSRDTQRRLNPNTCEVVKKEVLKWLDVGIINPISNSTWVSPTQIVPKKAGIQVVKGEHCEQIATRSVTGWRVCIDYRKLNVATSKYHFPLSFIDQIIEKLSGQKFYCFLDGYSGYNQIAIHRDNQEKTTFTFPYVFGSSFELCLNVLSNFLKRCVETNLVLSWEKSHFMVQEGIVLDHVVSSQGIEADMAKISVISTLPPPTNVKGVRSFLGHAGFYRRFIKGFSVITKPLCHLFLKDIPFEFNKECVTAFNVPKEQLVQAPILQSPDWNLPFEIMFYASDYAVGVVLGQRVDKKPFVIYYASKTLSGAQLNYTTTAKELLAREEEDVTPEINEQFPDEYFMSIISLDPWYAVDYVSKWVEAISTIAWFANLCNPTFFSRIGLPRVIISDGGSHFKNFHFGKLLKRYGKQRQLCLSELEELRDDAYENASTYKDKMKKSKWIGPYLVTKVGHSGDMEIEDFEDHLSWRHCGAAFEEVWTYVSAFEGNARIPGVLQVFVSILARKMMGNSIPGLAVREKN